MLSEQEQRRLHEVEQSLASEDPEFARSFEGQHRRDSRVSVERLSRLPRWVPVTALVVDVVLAVLMFATDATGTALLCLALAPILALPLRHRLSPDQPTE